jgi:eukaryotic-like serine/threonine-protein kinase
MVRNKLSAMVAYGTTGISGLHVANGLVAIGDVDVNATISRVGSCSHPTDPDDGVDADATRSLGRAVGDDRRFRVLRPHARGGLGAVFVALDAEPNREVALKQIVDHHADDPTSRTRFVLEAEITGGLEHPGIVPVYGLGSDGGGRPYYAMRFIRGDSLKDAIAAFHSDLDMKDDPGRRSLALRELLRRFVDVCNAIEYAHTRGVIHRDIKPANITGALQQLFADYAGARTSYDDARRLAEEAKSQLGEAGLSRGILGMAWQDLGNVLSGVGDQPG